MAKVSLHGDPRIYDRATLSWVTEVEAGWPRIRTELDQVMQYREQIPSFHEILKEASTITTDHNWKTFFLSGVGMNCEENARALPGHDAVARQNSRHENRVLLHPFAAQAHPRASRSLQWRAAVSSRPVVPEPREKCRIRIGNDFRHWTEGESLIFDDTFNHEVWNDTDGYRVVLFVDFARPLRFPFHQLNAALMSLSALAPFLREAGDKQRKWEQKLPAANAGTPGPVALISLTNCNCGLLRPDCQVGFGANAGMACTQALTAWRRPGSLRYSEV